MSDLEELMHKNGLGLQKGRQSNVAAEWNAGDSHSSGRNYITSPRPANTQALEECQCEQCRLEREPIKLTPFDAMVIFWCVMILLIGVIVIR